MRYPHGAGMLRRMETLFAVVGILVFVAVLQVELDRRARRDRKPRNVYLHLDTHPIFGNQVRDQHGAQLAGVRAVQYVSAVGQADVIRVEVFAHDGERYLIGGRRSNWRRP